MTWIVNINLTQVLAEDAGCSPDCRPAVCCGAVSPPLLGAFPIAGACSRGRFCSACFASSGCAFDSPGARDPQVADKLAALRRNLAPPPADAKKRRTDDSVRRFCIIGRSAGWRHPKPVYRLRTRLFAGAWNRTVCGGPAAVPEASLLSGAGRRMGCAVPTGLSPPEARPLPGYSSSVSV